jgi:predicted ATPase
MKCFESFALDTANECLWRAGVQIALAPRPFSVLRYLVENPGRLITHDELLDALWPETYVQPQVLRSYMLALRRVLEDAPENPRFIQTQTKRGYCFVAKVTEQAGSQSSPRSASAEPSILVGREEELTRLFERFALLQNAQRQVVFVTGEEGIGKTALVDGFLNQVVASSAAGIARGQCVQGIGAKEQYYPLMEALSRLAASPDGDRARRILANIAPPWLMREPDTATQPNTRPSVQDQTAAGLCAALEDLATEVPLILVFEDMDWADESTLNLISALARRRAPARLMLLGTLMHRKAAARPGLEELLQDLLVRRLCVEIALPPLKKASITELVSRKLGHSAPPRGLIDFVHRRSEGNPLFVYAALEHLISQRLLAPAGDDASPAWQLGPPLQEMEPQLPHELSALIELEIQHLSQWEQGILEAGSLAPVVFPAWAVAAALELDPAEVEEACDALARRLSFVERAGEDELPGGTRSAFYVFSHSLYREVLYRRQSPARRARRQIRVAERLGQLFAGREATVAFEMASLYESAGNWHSATNALRAAARHAFQRRAYADAAAMLEHSLQIAKNLGESASPVPIHEIAQELEAVRETAAQGAKTEN